MNDAIMISEKSISIAWAKAIKETSKDDTRPLCVSITDFVDDMPIEVSEIRNDIDEMLKKKNIVSVRETSETIFPYHHWSRKKPDIKNLTEWYLGKYLPRYRARVKKVRRGVGQETYFERLVAFKGYEYKDGIMVPKQINQINRILNVWNHYKNIKTKPSPSKFIASIYNPSVDNQNNSPRFPFPCLQQIGITLSRNVVTVSGYYTIQYLLKRGYGNYLALCHLGSYFAKETRLPLERVSCFVGNPRIDLGKGEINHITQHIK